MINFCLAGVSVLLASTPNAVERPSTVHSYEAALKSEKANPFEVLDVMHYLGINPTLAGRRRCANLACSGTRRLVSAIPPLERNIPCG